MLSIIHHIAKAPTLPDLDFMRAHLANTDHKEHCGGMMTVSSAQYRVPSEHWLHEGDQKESARRSRFTLATSTALFMYQVVLFFFFFSLFFFFLKLHPEM
jgi:hypothetical protein